MKIELKKRRTFFTLLAVSSLLLIIKLIEDVTTNDSIIKLDYFISEKVYSIRTDYLTKLMLLITNIVNPYVIALLFISLSIFFLFKKKTRYFLVLLISFFGSFISERLLKIIIQRLRPESMFVNEITYSFPSGHSTIGFVFFIMLFYSLKNHFKKQKIFFFLTVLLIGLIGFSRIYLGAHFFSDVVAGFALGLFWFCLAVLIIKDKRKDSEIEIDIKIKKTKNKKELCP